MPTFHYRLPHVGYLLLGLPMIQPCYNIPTSAKVYG
jgi:hypothetical protein